MKTLESEILETTLEHIKFIFKSKSQKPTFNKIFGSLEALTLAKKASMAQQKKVN